MTYKHWNVSTLRRWNLHYIIAGLIATFVSSSFALQCDPGNDRKGFDKYNGGLHSFACNVAHCCSRSNSVHEGHTCVRYGRSSSWDYTPDDYLIQDQEIHYPDISEDGAPNLEDLQKTYVDRMDRTLNCATYRMKYQANRELLQGNAIDDQKLSPHIRKGLQKQNERYIKKMQEEDCLEPSDDGDVTQQTKLTNATMYEQCVYEYYLTYYENTVNNQIGTAFTQKKQKTINNLLSAVFGPTAHASLTIREIREYNQEVTNRINAKMSLGRRTHEDAIKMHTNANKSHVSHALLQVIEKQLSEIRSDLEIAWRATLVTLDKGQNSLPPAPG